MRSGETYSRRQRSARTLANTSSRWCGSSVLFRYDAATPSTRRPSTWSFISEISGETTSATPVRLKASLDEARDGPYPTEGSAEAFCWFIVGAREQSDFTRQGVV